VLGFIAGTLLIAYALIPLFYKLKVVSIYEYLENRFGISTYKTGAWFFFISKMLGASVRLFLVCVVLQLLVFDPIHLPFILNVFFTVALVLALHIQRWSKSIDLDRHIKNLLPYYLCCSLHNFHRIRSAVGFHGNG
jgi:hypothetical protein